MIKSFRSKPLKRLVEKGDRSGLKPDHVRRITVILNALQHATRLSDMDLPGLKLHPLHGPDEGHHAVWVSGNWRITFEFDGGNAYAVDYRDYH